MSCSYKVDSHPRIHAHEAPAGLRRAGAPHKGTASDENTKGRLS